MGNADFLHDGKETSVGLFTVIHICNNGKKRDLSCGGHEGEICESYRSVLAVNRGR